MRPIGGEEPRVSERWLGLQGAAVDAEEGAGGEIANELGAGVVDFGGVEGGGRVADGPGDFAGAGAGGLGAQGDGGEGRAQEGGGKRWEGEGGHGDRVQVLLRDSAS